MGDQVPKPRGVALGNGFVQYNIYGHTFDVPEKYTLVEIVGLGAYGVVCKAVNNETQEVVAIKKVTKVFDFIMDAKRTLREILILRLMNHPNVMSLKELLPIQNPKSFEDVYLEFDFMPYDLHTVIHSGTDMCERQYQFILYQLLSGLRYIHAANIIHRDLKPSNILTDERCCIKITDFGLARPRAAEEVKMTLYVQTRWYRAPELLVLNKNYSDAVDIWSVALIYLEMVTKHVVIEGKSKEEQLVKVFELLGSPGEDELDFIEHEAVKEGVRRKLSHFKKRSISSLFPQLSPEAADLIGQMLLLDPRKRISAEAALQHPYLASIPRPASLTPPPEPISEDLGFDDEFSIEDIRGIICDLASKSCS